MRYAGDRLWPVRYYYGDATLAHSAPGSVTVILRNVEDLKNGVPPLRR